MLMIDEIEGMAEVQFRQMLEDLPDAELRRLAADDKAFGLLIPPLLTKREARVVLAALLSRPAPPPKPKRKRVAKKAVKPAEAVSAPDAPVIEMAPAPLSEPAEVVVPLAPAVPAIEMAEPLVPEEPAEAPEEISAPVVEPIRQPDDGPMIPASEERPSFWTRFKLWLRSKAGL